MKSVISFLIKILTLTLITSFIIGVAACAYTKALLSDLDKAVDVSAYNLYTPRKINPYLPNTSWNNVKPCASFFNETRLIKETVACANEKIWPDKVLDFKEVPIPSCYVILAQSPDVFRDGLLNLAIYRIGKVALLAIMGFYNTEFQEVFIVENIDMEKIYKHEIQHHLLHVLSNEREIGDHDHPIFEHCEPAKYQKSSAILKIEKIILSLQ